MRPAITGDECHQAIGNDIGSLHSENDLLPVTIETGIRSGRRHLHDDAADADGSVYRWAAKLGGASLSDAVVGWVVLLIQISSYVVLLTKSDEKRDLEDLLQATVIFKRKPADAFPDFHTTYSTTTEDQAATEEGALEAFYGEPLSYAISSIAYAVFLVLTFAGTDLRASWALIHTRKPYHVFLGLVILSSFVLLVMASISVLFSLANDDISFILGAAAVLFISDLDEKICAALKTVNSRYRLFWVAEAIFLSVALAVVGIIWLGETTATTSDGMSTPDGGLSSSEDDTEPWIQKWNEDTARAQIFNWLFACFIAPFGATVLAWEVAFVLQSVADRCDPRETTRGSSNLKQFFLLEAFFLVNLGLSLMELVFSQLIVSYDRVSLNGLVFPLLRIILPAVLTAVGVVGICLPCGKWYPPRSFCRALIGLGMGTIVFVSTPFAVERIYGFKSLLPELVVVAISAASWFTCIISLAAAVFDTFEGYPASFRVVAWRISTLGLPSSGDDDGDGGSSTVIGSAFVVVCMYVKLYVLEVFIYAIYFGDVKI